MFYLTEWKQVCDFAPADYTKFMRRPIVIDGRNCYAPEAFAGTGTVYDSIGRACVLPKENWRSRMLYFPDAASDAVNTY